jgi:G protein beta subunit-like protein
LIPEEDVPVASVTVASDGSTLCAGTNSVRSLSTWPYHD